MHLASPRWGDPVEFYQISSSKRLECIGYCGRCLRDSISLAILIELRRVTDRQTDTVPQQTPR